MSTNDGMVPDLVATAKRAALDTGFTHSCRDEVGRLLHVLGARPRVAELGTGVGVGSAWLASAGPGHLVTVEQNQELADLARRVLGRAAEVVCGPWTELLEHAPFDLVFNDARDAKYDAAVFDLLAPGGFIVIDDLTPPALQPPGWRPEDDDLRVLYTTPPVVGTELRVAHDHAVIVARSTAMGGDRG